ncbi:hypothetical protein E1293_12120 [Actinomadura darangshiensis]|uniref:Uncharacterized protein n=1 Tax=Actinomadura darangshiensis TaxID=705336 RepID=A0A4R5BLU1_9ACTN|nr:hypothetical protein [Actinomadura darangshiensis]TDD84872.1 hypothetical protein E1293_12120 [Actinomadura darangshiensis]
MNQSQPDDDRRTRLRDIEESLARLHADLPAPSGDATDMVDSGQYLAAREELQGQIELLEAERERLRTALGMT